MKTILKPLAALSLCGLVVACATTQRHDLAEIRAIAEKAAADAATANQAATAAQSGADAANRAAAAAQSRADAAMDTAASAKAQSEETESKIDRMFKKAMYK